jgi:tetratricopeptide (TPR) repeat protein
MPRILTSAGLVIAGLSLACSLQAQTQALFLDGGYAELCAAVALQAELSNAPKRHEMTGSRLGLAPLEICTRAVNGYDGSGENVAESYNNRGVILFVQGDRVAALADFDHAIREQASMAQAHINRGYTLNALERWAEAIPALTRGIDLGRSLAVAEMARAHFNRGIAHEESGMIREAYADYLKSAELEPEWEEPRLELSRFQVLRR